MPVIFNMQWDGMRRALPKKDTLENMSWSDIAKVCKAGKASEYWYLGEEKTITLASNDYTGRFTYTARIIGFNHDDVNDQASYGRAKAGITLFIGDTCGFSTKMYNSNNNGYSRNTIVKNTVLPAILAAMDEDLQNAIVPVIKKTANGNTTTPAYSDVSSLFLFSYVELFGVTTEKFCMEEGNKYANADGVWIEPDRNAYWLRSPSSNNTTQFGVVYANGVISSVNATNTNDITFAFCI